MKKDWVYARKETHNQEKHYIFKKELSMKKVVSLAMVFVYMLVCTISPEFAVKVNADTTSDGFVYDNLGAYCEITGYTGSETNLAIPSYIAGLKVFIIGVDAFKGNTTIESVTIPDTVATIRGDAFDECTNLKSITIGKSVSSIVTPLFMGCNNLEKITVDSANTNYDSRDNCNAIIYTKSNKLKAGCKNTVIPSTVTSIEGSAFKKIQTLTSIVIPDSVKSMGTSVFENCTGLKSVVIGSGIKSIPQMTFAYDKALTDVTFSSNVESIDSTAFFNTDSSILTIHAPSGSAAATFASSNGIKADTDVSAAEQAGTDSDSSSTSSTVTVARAKIKSAKNNAKKTVLVKWKKVSGAKGYQLQYSLKKTFKSKKTKTTTKLKLKIKKLKKKKTYFIRVRAYKVVNGTKKYGKWSKVKKVKIKK